MTSAPHPSGGLVRPRHLAVSESPTHGSDRRPQDTRSILRIRSGRRADEAATVPDDSPATRGDLAVLETLVRELISRDNQRAKSLARIEDGIRSLLADVAALGQRFDAEKASS